MAQAWHLSFFSCMFTTYATKILSRSIMCANGRIWLLGHMRPYAIYTISLSSSLRRIARGPGICRWVTKCSLFHVFSRLSHLWNRWGCITDSGPIPWLIGMYVSHFKIGSMSPCRLGHEIMVHSVCLTLLHTTKLIGPTLATVATLGQRWANPPLYVTSRWIP